MLKIHWLPMDFLHRGPVMYSMYPFHDAIVDKKLWLLAAPWNECVVIILSYLLQHLSPRSLLWDEWLSSELAVLIRVTALNYTNTGTTQEMLCVKTLSLRQDGHYFQTTFWNTFSSMKTFEFWLKYQLMFVHRGLSDNKSALIWEMAWCQTGDRPLSEPMMTKFTMHICIMRRRIFIW